MGFGAGMWARRAGLARLMGLRGRMDETSDRDDSPTKVEAGAAEKLPAEVDAPLANATTQGASAGAPVAETPADSPTTPIAPTAVRPQAVDAPAQAAPQEGSQTSPARRGEPARAWCHAHATQLGVAAAFLLIAAIIMAVTSYADTNPTLPSIDVVRAATFEKARLPEWSAGDYDADATMAVSDVRLVESHLDGSSGTCVSTVVVTFAAGPVEATQEAHLTFTRAHSQWSCLSYVTDASPSYHATAGADEGKLVDNAAKLLVAADAGQDSGEDSLAYLYRGATASLTSAEFDEDGQVEEAMVHLERDEGWRKYSCDVKASLRFVEASGAWELVSAQASNGAREPTYEALVGTWDGAFIGQDAGDGGKCLAASEAGLVVEVTAARATSSGGATIEGTVSGVVHFHPSVRGNVDGSDGDERLEGVSFSGALTDATDDGTLAFDCQTPDATGGTVTLRLQFGSESDASAVSATLTTTHPYQETIVFVPVDRTATFADAYTLAKG